MEKARKYLSHCATFFQIFGHQFFSVKYLTDANQKEYPSLSYTIYFFIMFFVMTCQMLIIASIEAFKDDHERLSAKTAVNYFVQHSMYLGLIAIICVSLISSFAMTPLLKKFYLNCLMITEMSLRDFNHLVDYKEVRRNAIKYFVFITLYFTATENFFYLYENYFNEPRSFARTCLGIIPLMFLNSTAFKFIFFVKIVNYHLETVNRLVQCIFKPPLTIAENLEVYVKPTNSNKSLMLSEKIKRIRRIYNVINENAEIINRSMGVTVLTVTSVMVIAITASGYKIFLTAVGKLPTEKVGSKI